MIISELLEKLVEDPFDDKLRSRLASHYVDEQQWEKAHKQYTLIKKQRDLSPDELAQFASCLRKLGFDEEAELISLMCLFGIKAGLTISFLVFIASWKIGILLFFIVLTNISSLFIYRFIHPVETNIFQMEKSQLHRSTH